jgi:hypothetical protein
MKAGDTYPVLVAGQVVAQATIKELGDGTATLVVPATLVVMATRTELTEEVKPEPEKDTVITGVDRPATQEANETAPVGENADKPAAPQPVEAPQPAETQDNAGPQKTSD